jgi:hypothetical protein
MKAEAINQYSKDIIDEQDKVIKSLTDKLNECLKKKVYLQSQLKEEREKKLCTCPPTVFVNRKDVWVCNKCNLPTSNPK